jgi:hypothetical protein
VEPEGTAAADRGFEAELTICKVFSAMCATGHTCGDDGVFACQGEMSCQPGSGCLATSEVPVTVSRDRTVALVRERDLAALRLGVDAQLSRSRFESEA